MEKLPNIVRLHVAAYSTFLSMKWMIESNSNNNDTLYSLMERIKKISESSIYYAVNRKIPPYYKKISDKVNNTLADLYQRISKVNDPIKKTLHIISFMELSNLLQQDIAVTLKQPNWILLHKEMKLLMDNYLLPQYPDAEDIGLSWYYEIFLGEKKYAIR